MSSRGSRPGSGPDPMRWYMRTTALPRVTAPSLAARAAAFLRCPALLAYGGVRALASEAEQRRDGSPAGVAIVGGRRHAEIGAGVHGRADGGDGDHARDRGR